MNLSDYDFYCPKCSSRLDSSDEIHLKTKRLNGLEGDVYLSTTFGDYKYRQTPNINFVAREKVDFACPSCNNSLHSSIKPDFVCLIMRVEQKFDFEILFSRLADVHETYIITEDGVESYGKDSNGLK